MTQGDGAMSPTVMKDNPFAEALATAQEAKVGCLDVMTVLWNNVQMLRGVETARGLFCVLGV